MEAGKPGTSRSKLETKWKYTSSHLVISSSVAAYVFWSENSLHWMRKQKKIKSKSTY